MGRRAFLALAVALTACAKQPPVLFGQRMPSGCTKESRSERCFGWQFDRMVMTLAFSSYYDDSIRAYVASIGQRLARANNDSRRWTFRILDEDLPQAYAGYNRTLYITRGALAVLRDEAELAAIIGHEMGHSISGHHRETIEEAHRDVGSTQLQQWRDLRYARDDEIQADEQAVLLLGRAGYDASAVERMLRAVGGWDPDDDDEDASDDRHPVWRERIARVAALAAHHPGGERNTARFNTHVAKLVVGDDPRTLAVLGTTVVFARAGIALDLPPEYKTLTFGKMVVFWTPEDQGGTIQLTDKSIARSTEKPDQAFTQVRLFAGNEALSVTVVKNDEKPIDLAAFAKEITAKARPPRADEVARLRPRQFDPTVPRPIWAR